MSTADNDNNQADPTNVAIMEIIGSALDKSDGQALADEITDDLIKVLQRAFPGTGFWHWHTLLGDFRAELADRLATQLTDLVESDTAIGAIEDALSPSK